MIKRPGKRGLAAAVLAVFTALLSAVQAHCATLYVSLHSTNPVPPYTTWGTAATNIQDAVGAANPGDTVLVTNGTYTAASVFAQGATNCVALTNAITLLSVNGASATVINANPGARCAYVGSNAVLNGFTLMNGLSISNYANGGGAYCESSGMIANSTIASNYCFNDGGGSVGGVLTNCIITRNSTYNLGCGAYSATLYNCLLISNVASRAVGYVCGGAGAAGCTLYNCTITDNSGGTNFSGLNGNGGGTSDCTSYNCIYSGNTAGSAGAAFGGALYNCLVTGNLTGSFATPAEGAINSASVVNCTVTGNTSINSGCAVFNCSLVNCIVCFNTISNSVFAPNPNWSDSSLDYCCTFPLPPGPGNITANPTFVDPAHGIFRLGCGSPCIDAGTNSGLTNDIRGLPRPVDGTGSGVAAYDIGAYEYIPAFDTGPTIIINANATNVIVESLVSFNADFDGCPSNFWWNFGDGTLVTNQLSPTHAWTAPGTFNIVLSGYFPLVNQTRSATRQMQVVAAPVVSVYYVSVSNTTPEFPYTNWATAATDIQDAVNADSTPGRLVLVADGVYSSGSYGSVTNNSRVMLTNNVVVQSVNGPATTTIQGSDNNTRCAYVANNSTIAGFTLTGGFSETYGAGGGVFCDASGIVSNCIITGNLSADYGGGSFQGTLYGCLITSNTTFAAGGGAYFGTLYNCTLSNNICIAENGNGLGGGAFGAILVNCLISSNATSGFESAGGGACGGLLINCLVQDNYSRNGGGAASNILWNCVVRGNSATGEGGGCDICALYNCLVAENSNGNGSGAFGSVAYNCTVVGNEGGDGFSLVSAYNTIIFSNSPANWVGTCSFVSCCTTPLPTSGSGNITNNPWFVSPSAGDYRLHFGSPCIDAGTNLSAVLTNDIIGTLRPLDGNGSGVAQYDMGAYEFNLLAAVGTNWLLGYGLNPNDPLVFASHPDGVPLTVLQSWIADVNPTNANSFLKCTAFSNGPPATVYFQSSSNRIYTLLSNSNLAGMWSPIAGQAAIPGIGSLMSLTDTNIPAQNFYRVSVAVP
jgi:hypothetical protein